MTFATMISDAIFLSFVVGIPAFAQYRKVATLDAFIEGGAEAIPMVVKLMPYLVGIMVACGTLRASGFFESVDHWLHPWLLWLGFPPEVLPLALIRPFSGSGATALMADVIHTHGGDAFVSKVAATMMGSTETTFFVIAVYFGSVGVRETRYAIHAGLIADIVGMIASVLVCRWLF